MEDTTSEEGPLKEVPLHKEKRKPDKKDPMEDATSEEGPRKEVPLHKEKRKSDKKDPMEDLQFHLHHIKHYKVEYTRLLLNLKKDEEPPPKEIDDINKTCDELITARNYKAHKAYIKEGITPSYKPSKPSKNMLGAGHIPLKVTRTFEHTKNVISASLDFAEMVLRGIEAANQPVKWREIQARVENLRELRKEFMEFIEYRDLERHNLEGYHQERTREDDQKAAALEVLELLKEKVEKEEDNVTKFLVCAVAPRCCIKLEPSAS